MSRFRCARHYYNSTNRHPDWIWRRANAILKDDDIAPSREFDSLQGYGLLKEAIRFKSLVDQANSYRDWHEIDQNYPQLAAAYGLITDPACASRASIEAGLLTRRSVAEIAFRAKMDVSVVNCYEAVFFNVRQSLDSPDYICNCVIDPRIDSSNNNLGFDVLLKIFAYHYGEHVLDYLVTKVATPMYVPSSDAAPAAIRDDLFNTLSMKAAMAIKQVVVNERTSMRIIDSFVTCSEAIKEQSMSGRSQDSMVNAIQSMMSQMQLSFGRAALNSRYGRQMYHNSAVELTEQELIGTVVDRTADVTGGEYEMTIDGIVAHNAKLPPLTDTSG